MKIDPMIDKPIALVDPTHIALIQLPDCRRQAMINDGARLIENRIPAFPCSITEFDVFPVERREQRFEAAMSRNFFRSNIAAPPPANIEYSASR